MVSDSSTELVWRKPIMTLSIVALILSIASNISNFVWERPGYLYNDSKILFKFPPIGTFLMIILGILPCFLFAIFVLKFYNASKVKIFMPIIFACTAVSFFIGFISQIDNIQYIGFVDGIAKVIIFNLIGFIAFGLATLSTLKSNHNRIFIIIAVSINILTSISSLIDVVPLTLDFVKYYSFAFKLVGFCMLSSSASSLILNIALLLFSLKNHIPPIIVKTSQQETIDIE